MQAAAVMLSAAPLWPLAMAYKEKWQSRSSHHRRNTSNVTVTSELSSPLGGYSPLPSASPTLSPTLKRSYSRRYWNDGSDVFDLTPPIGGEGGGHSFPSMPIPQNYVYKTTPVDFLNFPSPSPEGDETSTTPLLTVTGPGDKEDIVP